MALVTTQTPATPGLLEQLHADWRARGWDPATLSTFRMESEGKDGGGGDGFRQVDAGDTGVVTGL